MARNLLNRSEAHKRIASVLYPDDSADRARRRVSERCRRAIKSGEIQRGDFADEAFCRWALAEWPGLGWQEWMAPEARINEGFSHLVLPALTLRASVIGVPQERNELEEAYMQAETERQRLFEENIDLRAQVADLKSRNNELEFRLKNRLKKQSDSGKKGGRGNTL